MGYACPVCGDPQMDAGHLANHLAFTAITSGGDHEEWLDDHAPDWERLGEAELADVVVDHAAETEFPQVFEESGVHDHGPDHDHSQHGAGSDVDLGAARARGRGSLDDEARSILEEARRMTEEMRRESAGDDGDDDESDDPSA